MTSYELETYEFITGETFDKEEKMPARLRYLHDRTLELARHVGVRALSKEVMALIAVLSETSDDSANAKPAKPAVLPKRHPGRPTKKEQEERARLEEQLAEVT